MRHWILGISLLLVPALGAWFERPSATKSEIAPAIAERSLLGMWSRFKPEKEGDPQRFYYFHTGGIGLFRYGRMGLTYTQTFRYEVDAKAIKLTFNKSGQSHSVAYELKGNVLTLVDDPKMGGRQAYTKHAKATATGHGWSNKNAEHPLARLWVEKTTDGKGGSGFRMYQLQAPTIDGRGVGWYHEGDFHEWSTETLEYRRTGDRLSLNFPVRNERFVTDLKEQTKDGVRGLHLAQDPRNFWHPRTYMDGGPGFTMMVADIPLPYHVPGHGTGGSSCPHTR
ncbi:MAG: hypothetical protein AAFN74_03130 [Myxococcota bacterium]